MALKRHHFQVETQILNCELKPALRKATVGCRDNGVAPPYSPNSAVSTICSTAPVWCVRRKEGDSEQDAMRSGSSEDRQVGREFVKETAEPNLERVLQPSCLTRLQKTKGKP